MNSSTMLHIRGKHRVVGRGLPTTRLTSQEVS
jgi:hypothetical protein